VSIRLLAPKWRGARLARPDLGSGERREELIGALFVAPAAVLVFGLIVYPVVYDVAVSLTDAHGFSGPGQFVGLANFREVLRSTAFQTAGLNSALYTLVTSSLRVVLSIAMALVLWQLRWGRAVLFIALFVPWVFPAALSAFAFYWLVSPPFHTFYTQWALDLRFALADVLGEDLWHVGAIAFHDVWRSSTFMAIFLLAGLNSLPTEQLDYARIECRNGWQRFWYVILPMLRHFLVLGLLLSLVISFIDYTNIYLQSGGRITWPLVGTLSYRTSFFDGDTALGSAMTLAQLPVWFFVLWLGFRMFERDPRSAPVREVETSRRPEWLNRLLAVQERIGVAPPRAEWLLSGRTWPNARRRLWLGIRAVAIGIFAVFPIWWIFLQAIRPVEEDVYGNPFWTWDPTLKGFQEALEDRPIITWLVNTGIVLVVGVAITLLVSVLAGYALGRLKVPGRRWIARLMFASYFLPQPMVLVPIYQVFLGLQLDNTLLSIILLNQTLTVPFATWLCFTFFEGLPPDIEEHAALEASRWQVFRGIILPLSWPVIIAAGIFAAGVMASDFVYSGLLLVHNDVKTVAVGLGIIGISLDEFDTITGGIGLAAMPLVIVCSAFAPAYVKGLSAAMLEGS
jgi:ABC-type glycerol-3-phosphate transport system permease component